MTLRNHLPLLPVLHVLLTNLLASTDFVAAVPSRFAAMPAVRACCQSVQLPFESPVFTMSLMWHRRFRRDALHRWIRDLAAEEIVRLASGGAGFQPG